MTKLNQSIIGKDYVIVIGGINIDIIGFPNSNLTLNDSNPGKIKMSLGGVGRNIAENIVRLGVPTKLISAIGNDDYGKLVIDSSKKLGIDINDTFVLDGESTSIYLAVLNEHGDMNVAISDMGIIDKITIDFIKSKNEIIKNSKACVLDTNIPRDVFEYILNTNTDVDFFLDTVSTKKAIKVKDLLGYFHTIKPNKIEAEVLSGISINNEEDLKKCSDYFLSLGVKRVFISLGADGLYYNDGVNNKYLKAHKINVVNATGAGDAFIGALVYCYYNNFDIDYSARFAMAASVLALKHEDTINPNMSSENVKGIIQ
ncbi:MAG: PfkB family carbohydrate kinase [Bacilli bacterium]|nr:PfkB family carbohydrate kinase [Bacilli bacterium]